MSNREMNRLKYKHGIVKARAKKSYPKGVAHALDLSPATVAKSGPAKEWDHEMKDAEEKSQDWKDGMVNAFSTSGTKRKSKGKKVRKAKKPKARKPKARKAKKTSTKRKSKKSKKTERKRTSKGIIKSGPRKGKLKPGYKYGSKGQIVKVKRGKGKKKSTRAYGSKSGKKHTSKGIRRSGKKKGTLKPGYKYGSRGQIVKVKKTKKTKAKKTGKGKKRSTRGRKRRTGEVAENWMSKGRDKESQYGGRKRN